MAKAGHNKINRPKQDGYQITLDAENDNIKRVWIRFGSLDSKGKYIWDRTVAMEQITLKKKETKSLLKVNDDQLEGNDRYYQILCEVEGEHPDHPEMLLTEPTKLT